MSYLEGKPRIKTFDLGALVEIAGGYTFKDKYTLYAAFTYDQSFLNSVPNIVLDHAEIIVFKKWNCVMNVALGFKYKIGN